MHFEYDPEKSAINKAKHGIDLIEAQVIWFGSFITVPLGSGHGEERQAVFGVVGEKHWTAITTIWGGSIRIISVRRSRVKREAYYECKKED